MTEELVISQEWVLFKTPLNAFAFLGFLNKNRWPTLHTLLMFYLCVSALPWHSAEYAPQKAFKDSLA